MVVANSILAACSPVTEETPTGAAGAATAAAPTQAAGAGNGNTPAAPASPSPAIVEMDTPEVSPTMDPTQPSIPVTGTVSPDDPEVQASQVEFPGEDATLTGYLARPAGDGQFPVVLVCHENRGLTTHIQDVTRRLAKAGYVGLAVDLLSRQGGSQALSQDEIPGLLGNMAPEQYTQDFRSGWTYLQSQPFAAFERVGMVGFCYGGGVTWQAATDMPELRAAVPFYGPPAPIENVPNIQAAVLAIYGELDTRINQSIPAIEEAMLQNNKIFEKVIYPNADHAFHNDTGQRYNAEAAQDAWARTLAWFGTYLA